MAQHLHAVLGADADQELAGAAEVARAQRGGAVEVADVAEHLTPLAGQQVDDVDALGRPLQERGLRAQEVHVGVGGDPASLAPAQHPVELERQLVGVRARRSPACAGGLHFVAAGDLHVDVAERQVGHALARDVGVLVGAVDELAVVVPRTSCR